MSGDPHYATLLAEVEGFWQGLPDKPEETPEAVLKALWLTASGTPTSASRAAAATDLPPLDGAGLAQLRRLIDLKRGGQPVAHLTGRQNFMGLEMLAGPGALIPRQETMILARAAVQILKRLHEERGSARVIDLCTGCGNLPLAYAAHVPGCDIYAADLSAEAVELAKRNAAHLGLGRVEFRQGDLFAPFNSDDFVGKTDMVTCNPPYISAAKVPAMHPEISGHEPRLAFDGGPFGIAILNRLVQEAPRFLKPNSWLGFEVGFGQGPAMEKRLRALGVYDQVETHLDGAGHVRALFARTNTTATA